MDSLRYQAAPPPAAEDAPHGNEWFLMKLRYKQPEGDTSTPMEIPVAQEPVAIQTATAGTRFAAGVAAMGLALLAMTAWFRLTLFIIARFLSRRFNLSRYGAEALVTNHSILEKSRKNK